MHVFKSANWKLQTSVVPWVFFPSTLPVNLMTQVKPCGCHKTTLLKDELWIFYVFSKICQTLQIHTKTDTQWTHPSTPNHCSLMLVFLFIQLFSFSSFPLFFSTRVKYCPSDLLQSGALCRDLPLFFKRGCIHHTDVCLLMIWKMWVFLKVTDLDTSVARNRWREVFSQNPESYHKENQDD